ncbi:MAG: PAS domain S-box protein [Desulfuromonadales bacterium]
MLTISIDLMLNLSLLVAISIVSGFIEKRARRKVRLKVLLQGALFGGAAVIGMLEPLHFEQGLIFDGRSVMVSLCALFFGPWAAAVAAAMTIACRVWLGGVGLFMGISVILASAGIGLLAHFRFRGQPTRRPPSTRFLYFFGLIVHGAMLALMFTLPDATDVLSHIGLPVILLYPLATILVGKILSDQVTAQQVMADLEKTKQRLAITLESIGDAVISTNLNGDIVFMNSVAEKLTGWSQAEAANMPRQEVFRLINEKSRQPAEDLVARVFREGLVIGLANHTLLVAKDGVERPIADSAAPIRDGQGEISGVVVVFRDQSEERRQQRLREVRIDLLDAAAHLATEALLTKVLDETCALVGSPIGFYHFVETDQETLTLQQWSTRTTREFCRGASRGMHYGVHQAGIWADCVRQAKPVVYNDYASLPHKKGLPAGHAEIIRELIVPILQEGKVVAIMGVGNKPTPYTQEDVETVNYLANVIWHVIAAKIKEDRIQENEKLFRSLFENHAAVKLIIDPASGNIVNANQAAADYYGWSRERLKTMNIQDINTLSFEEIQKEMEKARTLQRIYFEFSQRRADGSMRDVAVFSSRFEVNGKHLLHSIIHDISQRKTAEQALKTSLEHFRLLVENAPDAIFVQTRGCFTYLNRAAEELFGAASALELIGTPVLDRLHPDYRARAAELIFNLHEKKMSVAVTHVVSRRLDGAEVDAEVSAVPMNFEGEDGALVFARNISARIRTEKTQQKLEEQLHQAQKIESLGQLAGGVAHDYNNMLAVILGYTDMAMGRIDPTDPLYQDLEQVLNAAKRSRDITQQLLAFARRETIVPQVVDLNTNLESMLRMLRRLIGENIALRWLPGAGLGQIKIDPSQLNQILINLCVNARDAIANTGTIAIETKSVVLDESYCANHAGSLPGSYVLLMISDSGRGMDKATQRKIFEPFFTTKKVGAGTGLGLSTVYGIVKQNNGCIDVYSEPGEGSSFKIYLPRHGGEASVDAAAAPPETPRGGGETILVVEDENSILRLTKRFLDGLWYTVLTANCPDEALCLAGAHPEIHLLITDVIMPGMNGRELAGRLRTSHPNIEIMYMSGYTADVIAHRGVLEQGTHFLQKPFSLTDLAAAVRTILE